MKRIFSLTSILVLGAVFSLTLTSVASAAPATGKKLTAAVLKMGSCTTVDGAIAFEKNGVAYWSIVADGEGTAYGNGAYGSDAYGEDAYGSDAYDVGAYDDSAYGPGKEDFIIETKWYVSGARVLLLVDGEYHSVTIGFRSKTCTIN